MTSTHAVGADRLLHEKHATGRDIARAMNDELGTPEIVTLHDGAAEDHGYPAENGMKRCKEAAQLAVRQTKQPVAKHFG